MPWKVIYHNTNHDIRYCKVREDLEAIFDNHADEQYEVVELSEKDFKKEIGELMFSKKAKRLIKAIDNLPVDKREEGFQKLESERLRKLQ